MAREQKRNTRTSTFKSLEEGGHRHASATAETWVTQKNSTKLILNGSASFFDDSAFRLGGQEKVSKEEKVERSAEPRQETRTYEWRSDWKVKRNDNECEKEAT